jgi:superfamily II DNA/RNA helicase
VIVRSERTKVMVPEDYSQPLIATDVASRGLDVKDVGAVVNYDTLTGTPRRLRAP